MDVLAQLPLPGRSVVVRRAVRDDVRAVVELLAADQLGARRDGVDGEGGLEPYLAAFDAVDADPAHLLVVATDGDEVVATLQLSVLPGLARRGALRARRGCALVQLTTDKARVDAHRFYERLGFVASHEGFKIALPR